MVEQAPEQGMATPLAGQVFKTDGVVIRECPPCGKAIVRGDFDNAEVASSLLSAIGLSPVMSANTFVQNDNRSLYWLGPDERLVYTNGASALALINELRGTLPDGKSAVVDVSDYYTVIQVSGEKARQVLSSGTPFDLHPESFSDGQCAQTRFGNASVMLSLQEMTPVIDVQVRWSFAGYLWGYLCRVANYC